MKWGVMDSVARQGKEVFNLFQTGPDGSPGVGEKNSQCMNNNFPSSFPMQYLSRVNKAVGKFSGKATEANGKSGHNGIPFE